jgi:para-aminobenzoate synthetase/4-amino-4-deoxychorismate lyase
MTRPTGKSARGSPRAIWRDAEGDRWLHCSSPVDVLVARRIEEVLAVLRTAEHRSQNEGLSAVGFVAYEAAPAFDPSLVVKPDGEFPLAWFGLFRRPRTFRELTLPVRSADPEPRWESALSHEEYRAKLASIREHLGKGDTYQVNFTHRLRATMTQDPWDFFVRLVAGRQIPYAAYIDTGEWAVLSATPELFFRLEDDLLESRPMKGTAARGRWTEEDDRMAETLRASEKDRAENVMIVDMVRSDMGRVAETGSVQVGKLFEIERYSTVWQMTSSVRAKTNASLTEIFRALFPAASITGAPKRRTMEIIAALESSPRRIYTGAIGWMMPGRRARFSVAIRTVLVRRGSREAEYGVGGGIVWDSDPDREWQECAVKTRVLRARAPEFELVETILWTPAGGFELLDYHLRRLGRSAAYFGFDFHPSRVEEELNRTGSRLSAVAHRVRLCVTRRGAANAVARPIAPEESSFGAIGLSAHSVDSSDVFLFHKTTNRSAYDSALESCPGFDDVLLYNERGEITETTIANVAVDIDRSLWTPPVSCGLLAGTYRAWLIDQQRIRERPIELEEVFRNPNVYLMNSVRGLQRTTVIRPEAPAGIPRR